MLFRTYILLENTRSIPHISWNAKSYLTTKESCDILIGKMTEKQKRIKRVELLQQADKLLGEALRLGGHHPCFGQCIVDAQMWLDDAITWADRNQTLLEKRS